MTRGQLVIVEPGRIITSTDYNGDMGTDMDTGKKALKELKKVKNLEAFKKLTQSFNDDYGYKDEHDTYFPCWNWSMMDLFDMTSDYFDKWFSDYLYIKNLSGETIYIKAKTDSDIGFELVSLEDGKIGVLNYGRYADVRNVKGNDFTPCSPTDEAIKWAFELDGPGFWGGSTLHRMASVKFHEDDEKAFDYIAEGYDVTIGDEVMVRGRGKELKKVVVTDVFWTTEELLDKGLPGGSSRYKKIEGKALKTA